MVVTIKKWETVYFRASRRGYNPVTIELNFNYEKL